MSDDEHESDWSDYDSGAGKCQHWNDSLECEEKCECGHPCKDHTYDRSCDEDGCECEQFEDEDVPPDPRCAYCANVESQHVKGGCRASDICVCPGFVRSKHDGH